MSSDAVRKWLQQLQLCDPPNGVEQPAASSLTNFPFESISTQSQNKGSISSRTPASLENNSAFRYENMDSLTSSSKYIACEGHKIPQLTQSVSPVHKNSIASLPSSSESIQLQTQSWIPYRHVESLSSSSGSIYPDSVEPLPVMQPELSRQYSNFESLSSSSESSKSVYLAHRQPLRTTQPESPFQYQNMDSLSSSSGSIRPGSAHMFPCRVVGSGHHSSDAESKFEAVQKREITAQESLSTASEVLTSYSGMEGAAQLSDECIGMVDSNEGGSNYVASTATSGESQFSPMAPISNTTKNVHYSIAQVLGDPMFWASAWNSLKQLNTSSPVDQRILDYHFMSEWLEHKEAMGTGGMPLVYYLDTNTLKMLEGLRNADPTLRRRLFLSLDGETPIQPVLLFNPWIQGLENQLFLFDFTERRVLILGGVVDGTIRTPSPQLDKLWLEVARVFGWSIEPPTCDKIHLRSWTQGGQYFGPRVVSLFESAIKGEWKWSKGVYSDQEKPTFPCDRLMLQKIFMSTLSRCVTYAQHWRTLHAEQQGVWKDLETSTLEEVNVGLLNFMWVTRSATLLFRNIQTCRSCTTHLISSSAPGPHTVNTSTRPPSLTVPHTLDEQPISSDGEVSDVELPFLPNEHSSHHSVQNTSLDGHLEETGQFNEDDDDYTTSPIQSSAITPYQSNFWVFGSEGRVPLLPNGILNWNDRGFRTSAFFFRTINTAQPTDVTPPAAPASPGPISIEQCRPSPHRNILSISGREMLDRAGAEAGTDASRRIFVRGKGKKSLSGGESQYLALDLEKDSVEPDCIKVSTDIDSLIWVTSAKHFSIRSLELFLSPKPRPVTGIDKNNFISVTLISPPQNSMELHEPKYRSRIAVPLSRIPHLELGYCGDGSCRINFFVFFPRMIWKNDKGRYSTRIPGQLIDLWYENAILPAFIAAYAEHDGVSEYQPHNLQEIRDRTGTAKQIQMNVLGNNSKQFMEELDRIVKQEDCLSCFGSFFIVADGRGMKFSTKQCSVSKDCPPTFDLIKGIFPGLDWDVMEDREKGELYLDLGTGYHAEHPFPLVGWWRIPHVLHDFKEMGSKKPTIFHFGTQKFHGGVSAEMSMKTKATSHLISGIYYCLAFEVVRNPGTSNYICSDADAVNRSTRFQMECQKWLSLISGAASQPYGVRQEIRGLAGVVLKRLDQSMELAKKFIESKPILWVPSKMYFGIVSRRFRELLGIHQQCFHLRLPNYRLMSLLIVYLLRHTMVIPKMKYAALDAALKDLRFTETITICGMFFLHGLNSTSMRIKGLIQEDPADLAKEFQKPFVKNKPKLAVNLELLPAVEANRYPWGEKLSNTTIKSLLNGSYTFMRAFNYETDIPELKHPLSSRLFRTFSAQIWLIFSNDYVQRPDIQNTLESSITQWTPREVKENICKVGAIINPTYDGLAIPEAKVLRPMQIFSNRKRLFFPHLVDIGNSPCKVFAKNPGDYLSIYHSFLKTGDTASIQALEEDLDVIFRALPLLPDSRVRGEKDKGKDDLWKTTSGKIEFVANPIYFKCTSVTFARDTIPKVKVRRAKLNPSAISKQLHQNSYGPNSYPKRIRSEAAAGRAQKRSRKK